MKSAAKVGRVVAALVASALLAVAWWLAADRGGEASGPPNAATTSLSPKPAVPERVAPPANAAPGPSGPPKRPPSPLAAALGAPGGEPAEEARLVLGLLEAYRRERGEFPTGENNRAIMRLLTGRSGPGLAVVPPVHPRLTPSGELVDAWGTPFFFHVLSRQRVEVRSAGPDREMFTEDDLKAAPGP